MPRIVDAAALDPTDETLEIGAGTGILTEALAAKSRRVVAIELDDALYEMLAVRFGGQSSVEVWHGNVLSFDPCEHFAGRYKLVANIPYYITGPVVRRFLEAECRPELLVLMVQREVAERMAAVPPSMSLLGLSVQLYADVRILSRVPAGAFYPPPKVESAIVRLTPRSTPLPADPAAFFAVARAGFGQKRKQIANSLAAGLNADRSTTVELLKKAGIAPTLRAEAVPMERWIALAEAWKGV